jgi:hypothetical protein
VLSNGSTCAATPREYQLNALRIDNVEVMTPSRVMVEATLTEVAILKDRARTEVGRASGCKHFLPSSPLLNVCPSVPSTLARLLRIIFFPFAGWQQPMKANNFNQLLEPNLHPRGPLRRIL